MSKDFYCDREKAGGEIALCINKINHYRGDATKISYTCIIPNFYGETQHCYINRKTFLMCLLASLYRMARGE